MLMSFSSVGQPNARVCVSVCVCVCVCMHACEKDSGFIRFSTVTKY